MLVAHQNADGNQVFQMRLLIIIWHIPSKINFSLLLLSLWLRICAQWATQSSKAAIYQPPKANTPPMCCQKLTVWKCCVSYPFLEQPLYLRLLQTTTHAAVCLGSAKCSCINSSRSAHSQPRINCLLSSESKEFDMTHKSP